MSGVNTDLVEATNPSDHDTVIEFEHCVADLLQQWRVVWLKIILRWQCITSNDTLRHIFKVERSLSLCPSAL